MLQQTWRDLELVVVDDGSTDGTRTIIAGFQDTRLRYLRLPQRAGAAKARNVGILGAKGEMVAFQDSDDEWMPEKLEKQVAVLHGCRQSIGVVYSPFIRVTNTRKAVVPKSRGRLRGRLVDRLLLGNV